MKCKVFKIHLDKETGNFEEAKFNKFLGNVKINQTFASAINNEFWSIFVFYQDTNSSFQNEPEAPTQTLKDASAKIDEFVKPTPKPVILTAEQEQKFNKLKQWRNVTRRSRRFAAVYDCAE